MSAGGRVFKQCSRLAKLDLAKIAPSSSSSRIITRQLLSNSRSTHVGSSTGSSQNSQSNRLVVRSFSSSEAGKKEGEDDGDSSSSSDSDSSSSDEDNNYSNDRDGDDTGDDGSNIEDPLLRQEYEEFVRTSKGEPEYMVQGDPSILDTSKVKIPYVTEDHRTAMYLMNKADPVEHSAVNLSKAFGMSQARVEAILYLMEKRTKMRERDVEIISEIVARNGWTDPDEVKPAPSDPLVVVESEGFNVPPEEFLEKYLENPAHFDNILNKNNATSFDQIVVKGGMKRVQQLWDKFKEGQTAIATTRWMPYGGACVRTPSEEEQEYEYEEEEGEEEANEFNLTRKQREELIAKVAGECDVSIVDATTIIDTIESRLNRVANQIAYLNHMQDVVESYAEEGVDNADIFSETASDLKGGSSLEDTYKPILFGDEDFEMRKKQLLDRIEKETRGKPIRDFTYYMDRDQHYRDHKVTQKNNEKLLTDYQRSDDKAASAPAAVVKPDAVLDAARPSRWKFAFRDTSKSSTVDDPNADVHLKKGTIICTRSGMLRPATPLEESRRSWTRTPSHMDYVKNKASVDRFVDFDGDDYLTKELAAKKLSRRKKAIVDFAEAKKAAAAA